MRCAVLMAFVALASGVARAADVTPVGEPDKMEVGQTVRYYLWCDETKTEWHLRTTTAKQNREFSGTVRVQDGAIRSVSAVRLEKKGDREDFWEVKDSGRELAFDLKTEGGMDGFDFTVDKAATELQFDLKIDGESKGRRVFMGRTGKSMNTSKFFLRIR